MMLLEMTGTPIGSYAPDFELPDTEKTVHHLARHLARCRVVGVIFMCNHCPYVQQYLERLKQIQRELEPEGLTLIGINANDAGQFPEDGFDLMKTFVTDRQLNFPYLWDPTQDVARSFGAEKTPHAFLLDSQGILRYRGGIDDNAEAPELVKKQYLHQAIIQLLNNETVTPASTEPVGCSLKWRR